LRNRTATARAWKTMAQASMIMKSSSLESRVIPPTAMQHMARMRTTAQNGERRSSSSSSRSLRAQYFRSPPRIISVREPVNSISRDAAPVITIVYPRTSRSSSENSYQVVQRPRRPFHDSQMSMMPITAADRKNAEMTTLSKDSNSGVKAHSKTIDMLETMMTAPSIDRT